MKKKGVGNIITSLCGWRFGFFLVLSLGFLACPAKQDSIVIVYDTPPRSLDPHLKKELITLSILGNIYEPLVGFDANMKIIPLLADYWERKDSLTWVFYLRDKVIFHNGRKCQSADVVYSLYRPNDLVLSEFNKLHDILDTIMTANKNEILIRTKIPNAFLPYDVALISIIPQGFNPQTQDPIGTGPYRFGDSTSTTIVLEAFPEYWGERVAIKKVNYIFVPELDERIRLFTEGKADIVGTIPITAVQELHHLRKVVPSAGNATRYLEFNHRKYPFNSQKFRQAVNLGINREALAKNVYYGYAVPANQYIEPGVFGYDPTLAQFIYDPDSARKLLAQLDPLPEIGLDYLDARQALGEAVAEQLKDIGLSIKLNPLTAQECWVRIENHISDCYLIANVPNSWEGVGDITNAFHTRQETRGLGLQNWCGYANPKLDLIIESLPLTVSQQDIAQKIARVQALLLNDIPKIPIVWEKFIYCVAQDIDWVLRLDDMILIKEIKIKEITHK